MWKKVVAPTLVVSLFWVVASGGTTLYIRWLSDLHRRSLAEDVTTIRAAAAMQTDLWRIQTTVLEAIASHDDTADAEAKLARPKAAFAKHFREAEYTAFTKEEQVLIEVIRGKYATFLDRAQGWLTAARASPSASPPSSEEVNGLVRTVVQPCMQLLQVNQRLLEKSNLQDSRLINSVTVLQISCLIAGPLIGILFGIWVARGLNRSVSQISVTLKGATGELEQELGRVDLSPSGELPQLHQQVEVVACQIKRVVAQLQDARREVIRSERLAAVGELAAGVAHELRNPLTSVKLLVQTAAQRFPDRPLDARQLQVIVDEVARLEHTIQSLLDFARPPSPKRIHHDVCETLRRALNLTAGRAEQEGVVIAQQWPEERLPIDADPEQLQQVFVNLLLNGIESMPEGGTLRVSSRRDDVLGICRVVVSDNGEGIPPEIMQRMFEPFVTGKERGTGLGLAVSRRIVQEHGGTISAANQAGEGAVFTVELPLDADQPSDLRQAAPRAGNGHPLPPGDRSSSAASPRLPSPQGALHAETSGH